MNIGKPQNKYIRKLLYAPLLKNHLIFNLIYNNEINSLIQDNMSHITNINHTLQIAIYNEY